MKAKERRIIDLMRRFGVRHKRRSFTKKQVNKIAASLTCESRELNLADCLPKCVLGVLNFLIPWNNSHPREQLSGICHDFRGARTG